MGDVLPLVFLVGMYASENGRETVIYEYIYVCTILKLVNWPRENDGSFLINNTT